MKLELVEYLPEYKSDRKPLLFVHGAYHGAWCWEENFLPYFSERGYPSYALSLRGHGKSEGYEHIRTYNFKDYVADVVETISKLKEKPVLIGHSMGGAVVQKTAEQQQDKISGMILVGSFPFYGTRIRDMLKKVLFHYSETRQLRIFNSSEAVNGNEAFPLSILFSDNMAENKKQEYSKKMQRDSELVMSELMKKIVSKPEDIKVPVLVAGSTTDWFFSTKSFEQTAKAYGTKSAMFKGMGHDMMLEPDWEKLAEEILRFLTSKCFSR